MAKTEAEFLDLSAAFGTDKNKEEDGIDVIMGAATLTIAYWKSKPVKRKMRQVLRPHRQQFNAGIIKDDLANDLNAKIIAQSVLKGWKGVGMNGKALPFSEDNAYKALKGIPGFLDAVLAISQDKGNFQADDIEEEGN